MNRKEFESFLAASSTDGSSFAGMILEGNGKKEMNGSSSQILENIWMKDWMQISASCLDLFRKEQYGRVISKIEEFEQKHSNKLFDDISYNFYFQSMVIDKTTCKKLSPTNTDLSTPSLDGAISQVHRDISIMMTRTLTINDMKYLLFGLKVYLSGIVNDCIMKQSKSKEVISTVSTALNFVMNVIFIVFLKKDLKEFEQYLSLQEAIEQNFSGFLFEDDTLSSKRKKRKTKKTFNLPLVEYVNNLVEYVNTTDATLIRPMIHFHLTFFNTWNYLNSFLVSRGKYSRVIERCYHPSKKTGVALLLLKRLSSFVEIGDGVKLDIEECIVNNQIHIAISLLEEGASSDAISQCSLCTNSIPSQYLMGIISFEENRLQVAKDCFLKVIDMVKNFPLYGDYESKSTNMIALVYVKQWKLPDALSWFQMACNLESKKSHLLEAITMYNMCKLKGLLGEYYSKRKVLTEIYRILTNSDVTKEEKDQSVVNPIFILYHIGCCLAREENFENAVQCFEYVITNLVGGEKKCWGILNQSIGEEHADEFVSPTQVIKMYVYCLLQSHRHEKALAVCNYALEKTGNKDITLMMYTCDAMMALERPIDECEQFLNSILKDKKHLTRLLSSVVYNNKALMLVCKGQESEALTFLKKAFTLLPETLEDKKLFYDVQCCIVFNIALACLALNQLEEATRWWFSFRKISLQLNSDQYKQMATELEQKELGNTMREDVEIGDTFTLISHISGKCSRKQQVALDLFMLNTYSKHLSDTESIL